MNEEDAESVFWDIPIGSGRRVPATINYVAEVLKWQSDQLFKIIEKSEEIGGESGD